MPELVRVTYGAVAVPLFAATPATSQRVADFLTANIRNPHTRAAYVIVLRQFSAWCEAHGLQDLVAVQPIHVAAYIDAQQAHHAAPTVKQHLAALRRLFDYLVVGQVVPTNPAAAVRGPTHVVTRGKTPALTAAQARALLDSLDTRAIAGVRDRALIGVMVYTFARVGAVTRLRVADYYVNGKRWWFRLHEKGGKRHDVPAHHLAEAYVDAYLTAAGIANDRHGPLFRTVGHNRQLTDRPMRRTDVLRMIKRRARAAGLPASTCCHTFRATGITTYLQNGGTLDHAQAIAAHASPKTTKLYDRTRDELTLDEIERIRI